jgi:hypothetical protein
VGVAELPASVATAVAERIVTATIAVEPSKRFENLRYQSADVLNHRYFHVQAAAKSWHLDDISVRSTNSPQIATTSHFRGGLQSAHPAGSLAFYLLKRDWIIDAYRSDTKIRALGVRAYSRVIIAE